MNIFKDMVVEYSDDRIRFVIKNEPYSWIEYASYEPLNPKNVKAEMDGIAMAFKLFFDTDITVEEIE